LVEPISRPDHERQVFLKVKTLQKDERLLAPGGNLIQDRKRFGQSGGLLDK
jgi:hypothetical protein